MRVHSTNTGEFIETRNTVISTEVMLRTWARMPGGPVTDDTSQAILSDVRLTADQARNLAADLLHAARMLDGQQVTFKWHRADCTPVYRANGLCTCKGVRQAVAS